MAHCPYFKDQRFLQLVFVMPLLNLDFLIFQQSHFRYYSSLNPGLNLFFLYHVFLSMMFFCLKLSFSRPPPCMTICYCLFSFGSQLCCFILEGFRVSSNLYSSSSTRCSCGSFSFRSFCNSVLLVLAFSVVFLVRR